MTRQPDIRYIDKTDEYWLLVKPSGGGVNFSVPYGLKVDLIETKDQRDYFKVLEGVHKGETASVSRPGGKSFLTKSITHTGPVKVEFDLKAQTIKVAGKGPYNAFSGGGGGFTPISPGTYDLAIPAYPSAQTRPQYATWAKRHNLWFRIGTSTAGSRFLHCGQISEGCVTVRQFLYDPVAGTKLPAGFEDLKDKAKNVPGWLGLPLPATRAPCVSWDRIVDMLILARKNDQAVGTLVVT